MPPDISFVVNDNVYFGSAATNGPIAVVSNGVAAGEMFVTNAGGTVTFNGGTLVVHDLTKTGAGSLVISNTLDLEGGVEPIGVLGNTGSGNVTVNGNIIRGAILQAGTGTLTLSASNSYAGGTTISNGLVVAGTNNALGTGNLDVAGGTLSIGSSTQTLDVVTLHNGSITGAGTLTGTAYFVENGSIAANLAGSAGLRKSTAGTVTLSGTNTYTGGNTIQGGVLQVGADANLGATNSGVQFDGDGTLRTTSGFTSSRAFTFGSAGTIDATTNAFTITGALSGGGAFTKTGAGTLIINTDANTQSGGMLIGAGVLQVGAGGSTGVLGAGNITNNGGLVFNRTGELAVNNVISGSGGLTNLGTGTVTLSGSNTYDGVNLIAAGALRIANSTALGTISGATIVSNAAALEVTGDITTGATLVAMGGSGIGSGGALRNISGSNSFGAVITLTADTRINSDSGTLNLSGPTAVAGSGYNLTFGGAGNSIVGTGIGTGSGSLVKDGAGTLILTGVNTYTGGTLISQGTLQIGNGANLPGSSSTSAITNNGTLAYRIGTGIRTNSALISGTGNLVVDSPGGAVTMQGSNSYTGGTTIIAGELHATTSTSFGTGDVTLTGTNLSTPAILAYGYTNAPLAIGALLLDGNAMVDLQALSSIQSSGAITINDTNNFISIAGSTWNQGTNILIKGTSVTTNVDSTILLTGSTLNGATLGLGASTTIGRSTYTFGSNATSLYLVQAGTRQELLWTGASNNVWNTNSTNWVLAPGGVATTNSDKFYEDDRVYFGNAATNATIQLTNNILAGGMYVTNTNGTVRFGGAGSMTVHNITKSGAGDLVISNTLNVEGSEASETYGTFSNTGSGNVTIAGTWTNGALLQAGAGTVTLSVSNTHTGGTTISNGTVVTAVSGALGTGPLTVSGGTLSMGATTQSAGVVTLNSGSISGTGTLSGTSYLLRDGSIAVNMAGAGGILKSTAGTVTLSGTNTFSGGINLQGGTLSVSSDANLGDAANVITFAQTNGSVLQGTASFSSSRGFVFGQSGGIDTATNATVTLTGAMDGPGALTKSGAGTLVLATTSNLQFGGTLISAGVLQIGAGGTNGTLGVGNITNNGGLVFNRTGTMSVANAISGTGGLTNAGAGTVTLTGDGTYSGATRVSAGTLVLSNTSANAVSGSSIQVDAGATLTLAANNQIGATTGLILNGGTFIAGTSSAGYSDTLGTLTLSASSVIDLGAFTGTHTIQFADSSAISWATNAVLTISNWQGIAQSPGTAAQILFGGTAGLTSTQLAQIRFTPYGDRPLVDGGVLLGSSPGELAPIPEAKIVWGAAALLGTIVWRERKRLRFLLRRR